MRKCRTEERGDKAASRGGGTRGGRVCWVPLAKNEKGNDVRTRSRVPQALAGTKHCQREAAGPVSPASLQDGSALTSPEESRGAWAGTRGSPPPPPPPRSGEPAQPKRGVGGLGAGARPSPRDNEGVASAMAPRSAEARAHAEAPLPRRARRRGGPRGLGGRDSPPRSLTKCGGRAGPGALARGRPPSAAPCDSAPCCPPPTPRSPRAASQSSGRSGPRGRGEVSGLWPGPLPAHGGKAPAPSLCVLLC